MATDYKDRLREYVESVTERSRGKDMYCCPLCDSGKGSHGTGAFHVYNDGRSWKCFSCDEGGDIYRLVGLVEHIPTFAGQRARLGEIFGREGPVVTHPPRSRDRRPRARDESPEPDQTDFLKRAGARIGETGYWRDRGLSPEVARRFHLGFDPAWRNPRARNAPASPRLIIPTGPTSYLARDTRGNLGDRERNYSKIKVGRARLFNEEALRRGDSPVWVVEGEIDAMSVVEAGGEALALGSTSNWRKLVDALRDPNARPTVPLLISLDNDKPGTEATEKLAGELSRMGVEYEIVPLTHRFKDANEALLGDRAEMERRIMEKQKEFENKRVINPPRFADRLGMIENSILTPKEYPNFLRAVVNHRALSPTNILAVYSQAPDATCLASFENWKKVGRYPERGTHAIQVVEPVTSGNRGEKPEFKMKNFFDISQTGGKPYAPKNYRDMGKTPEKAAIARGVLERFVDKIQDLREDDLPPSVADLYRSSLTFCCASYLYGDHLPDDLVSPSFEGIQDVKETLKTENLSIDNTIRELMTTVRTVIPEIRAEVEAALPQEKIPKDRQGEREATRLDGEPTKDTKDVDSKGEKAFSLRKLFKSEKGESSQELSSKPKKRDDMER